MRVFSEDRLPLRGPGEWTPAPLFGARLHAAATGLRDAGIATRIFLLMESSTVSDLRFCIGHRTKARKVSRHPWQNTPNRANPIVRKVRGESPFQITDLHAGGFTGTFRTERSLSRQVVHLSRRENLATCLK